jgi:uncharacterized membrane protein
MSAPYQESGPPSGAPGGKTSLGLESNVGAMLCYLANILCCLGVILAVVFLVTEKENRFVKFHAVQSLFLVGVQLVVGIAVGIVGLLFRMALSTADLGLIAVLLVFGLRVVLLLIFLAVWLLAGIKAYGGQWYKLPVIGNLAWNIVNKESNT